MRYLPITLLLLALAGIASLATGAVPVSWEAIAEQLLGTRGVVFLYRLPRFIVAVLVGFNMALAGAILQGLVRNPLAAPDVVGVTAGGGLATVVALLLFPDAPPSVLPVCAFLGAAGAGLLVYAIGSGASDPDRLVLCGVAVSSLGQALITMLLVSYAPSAAEAMIWLKGSLYARGWHHVFALLPWTVAGGLATLVVARPLNLLLLDEESVIGLGLPVARARGMLLALATGLAASSVAVAGTIGFVGLVIPHLGRLLVGADFRHSLLLTGLLGALFVAVADAVGRSLAPPLEIPAGILTAMLGAPYFLYLLVKRGISW